MSADTTSPDQLLPPRDLAGFLHVLVDYLSSHPTVKRVVLDGGDNQTLAPNLRQRGIEVWTTTDAVIGAPFDLLVRLNPTTLPEAAQTGIYRDSGAVLVIWESQPLLTSIPEAYTLDEWFSWLAQMGFYPEFTRRPRIAGFLAVPFNKSTPPSQTSLAASYERLLWQASAEAGARRDLLAEMRDELSINGFDTAEIQRRSGENLPLINQLRQQNDELYHLYNEIYNSESWKLMRRLHKVRHRFIPPGSRSEARWGAFLGGLAAVRTEGLSPVLNRIYRQISWRMRARFQSRRYTSPKYFQSRSIIIAPIEDRPPPKSHSAQVDIIICIHNALEDVKACLQSVLEHSNQPYSLILVDDGSQDDTRAYLAAFAAQHECVLIRNENARGYTRAANQGLLASRGDFVVLLNSDTIVTPRWLDQMAACMSSNDRIGIVGPLSNTASWQSIPFISENGDWAANPLPLDLSVEGMAALVASGSARLYPELKLLNGFCLFIRRGLLDQIGGFDEETFGTGYGEEDDFCLRARAAGWQLALADDTYIYHAQSKSYSTERRQQLYTSAGEKLRGKHGEKLIKAAVDYNQNNLILQGIRARSQRWLPRQSLIASARKKYTAKRVMFILPITVAGGGGNIIISEARAMRQMGVDIRLFNLPEYRLAFEQSYPDLEIPVVYATPQELPDLAGGFDALIATMNTSVAWLKDVAVVQPQLKLGYYVQGFEPLMYAKGSPEYHTALQSYTLLPGIIPFTKTTWTRQQVLEHSGAVCQVVGPSVEIDLYRPRPNIWVADSVQPVRIAAMIRANSVYRSPRLTMEVLQKASWRYGPAIEVLLFGIDPDDPEFIQLPLEFAWRASGLLNPRQVARLMSEADIFVDFSQHQAMGLSALEAMACGAAVIVPRNGGAVEFVHDGRNGLVVDTGDSEACWQALQRLLDDASLRQQIQNQAIQDVCQYFPEQAAANILKVLFDE